MNAFRKALHKYGTSHKNIRNGNVSPANGIKMVKA